MLTCSAVLFDLDGVLVDSTPAVERVWRGWAAEHGLDPDFVMQWSHGRRSIETIRRVAPAMDAPKENLKVERREIEDLEGVHAIEGAADLLAAMPPGHWTVVTSATRELADAINAASPADAMVFLTNELGRPFTARGFSKWFVKQCERAGLQLSAHGLRKAACRRLAEAGCSANEIAAISGHASLREVERYTKAADQARLARNAMARTRTATSSV